MSLSFAPISDISANSFSSFGMNTSNINDSETILFNQKHSDVLSLYNEELERRKKVIDYENKDIDKKELELEDINFLQNVIKIKCKITDLKTEHATLLKKSDCIQKDITDVENIKSMYENFSASYLSLLNKEGSREIMVDLLNTIDAKYIEKDKLDKKINEILTEIAKLKNIIRVDNIDNDVPVDTELNPALLCFTCHESHITHCFTPCGHSFCEKCVSRVRIGEICFMCRAKVRGNIKLFFS